MNKLGNKRNTPCDLAEMDTAQSMWSNPPPWCVGTRPTPTLWTNCCSHLLAIWSSWKEWNIPKFLINHRSHTNKFKILVVQLTRRQLLKVPSRSESGRQLPSAAQALGNTQVSSMTKKSKEHDKICRIISEGSLFCAKTNLWLSDKRR